jgi:WD40 repeat protein
MNPRPYCRVPKQQILTELKKMGFASDWHPHGKEVEKFPGDEILMLFDQERTYGEKFIWCNTKASYDRENERLLELIQTIKDEFEASLVQAQAVAAGGVVGEGGEIIDDTEDLNLVVRDLPRVCGEWTSETMEATHQQVGQFTVPNTRPLMQVMITRPRSQFGKACKFSDSGENIQNCRPQKDPNFTLQRKELEVGIQAVRETRTSACQTAWFRPVSKSTQYSPDDFLQADKDLGHEQVDMLAVFLAAVSRNVEEALQTNETVDIFKEEFAHLGEEVAGAGSGDSQNIRSLRNFQDVQYTKGKRIEWIEWVPNSTDMIACSYCENVPFVERLDTAGKATQSTILVWSFQDAMSPHAILISPWEVPVFKFYPGNERFLVAGLANGQLAVWKLADADLGRGQREKSRGGAAVEEEKRAATVAHKQVSLIDESHKRPILAIEWLPPVIELERRGRGASEKNPKDGPVKYFVTIAPDGQVMIWDFQSLLDAINDTDFVWKPAHKVQMHRQDSGTDMGCCHLLYCKDKFDEKGNKQLTMFYASTEEGELVLGDWAASKEEDRKPGFCKEMMSVSKTFRPMLSLERSPFFKDILLGVTDWAFYLWKDGISTHLFQSSYTLNANYFTRGVWSPTRPSVIFLGLFSGHVDIWDFSDQSHKASLSDTAASVPISAMVFLKPERPDSKADQKMAVGDAQGQLHVHNIPKNLVVQSGKEEDSMRKFLDREEQRVKYFTDRRVQLVELKDQMEKEAQRKADAEAAAADKAAVDEDKLDQHDEQIYKALEAECIELLATPGAVF